MKRWVVAFGFAILGCVLVLLHRASGASLLDDTDTRVLLEAVRARHAPFSWFVGDWPLQNHFYRPVSTLVFELDNRLYGNAAWGYGLTNALLCVVCTLLLFWFLRELTDSAAITGCATFLFALWETSSDGLLVEVAYWLPWAILVGGIWRHRLKVRMWAPSALVAWEFGHQINSGGIESRTLDWLPGRTAITMTVFALAALASYARYERMSAARPPREPKATDSPRDWSGASRRAEVPRSARDDEVVAGTAPSHRHETSGAPMVPVSTNGAVGYNAVPPAPTSLRSHGFASGSSTRASGGSTIPFSPEGALWALLAIVFTLLALGAYEQGVMVPALLLAVACTFRWRGYRVRWGWQAPFWGCLVVYWLVRHRYVPAAPSSYQLQQFRTGPGVWVSIIGYTFPSLFDVATAGIWISDLPMTLLTTDPWAMVLAFAADVATVIRVRQRWVLTFAGFGMSIIAFLPMAWVKEFAHYHYLPLALRTLFVVMLGWVAWEGALSAWSPQAQQAPPRRDPAPGSLPHP